jgi:hypothetical protein
MPSTHHQLIQIILRDTSVLQIFDEGARVRPVPGILEANMKCARIRLERW